MERLRATIEQYSRWKDLGLYIDRMEAHLETDFSISVENAKALLESVGKEICSQKSAELERAPSINKVIKTAFTALGYSNQGLVSKISGSLASISEEVGNLRNEISPTSHGKTLGELRERNDKVNLMTREFLIDSTLTVARFMIRAFEERQSLEEGSTNEITQEALLNYAEAENFNEFWDESFGEFVMGELSHPASEILFHLDYDVYVTEYKLFKETELETGE